MLFLSRSGLFRVSGEREEATCDVSHRAVSGADTLAETVIIQTLDTSSGQQVDIYSL